MQLAAAIAPAVCCVVLCLHAGRLVAAVVAVAARSPGDLKSGAPARACRTVDGQFVPAQRSAGGRFAGLLWYLQLFLHV